MKMDELLTVQDAAKELGVTDISVRAALNDNRLPFIEKYGRKLITRGDVEAYRQRTQPEGKPRVGRPRIEPGVSHAEK